MALLQPKLSIKVSQRQVLTPGLMQMVSVLALNKLELKEMINSEIVENPVLEEVDETVPLLDEIAGREAERDLPAQELASAADKDKNDPFNEIDFGSYFQEYLDPGFRTASNFEDIEKPSFENFLSQPSTLTDHLNWQLGSLTLSPAVRQAAEYIIGNLNPDGYLPVSDDELLDSYLRELPTPFPVQNGTYDFNEGVEEPANADASACSTLTGVAGSYSYDRNDRATGTESALEAKTRKVLAHALSIVQRLDPVGIATRDLRECLQVQIQAQCHEFELIYSRKTAAIQSTSEADSEDGIESETPSIEQTVSHEAQARREVFRVASCIVDQHLNLLMKRDLRELAKAVGHPVEQVQQAFDFIRTLDPRPGQRYNNVEARLIEPDVAIIKRGDEYVVVMNDEDLPTLRLNNTYRKLLSQQGTDREVKDYVKERYRSALQLMRNIEQRKNTIHRTCEAIIRRQHDFLEQGVNALKPMMIKEVAEEIGVHPSTVSRAVSNKYVHTSQGVYELRFFFSEGVNGPEGAGTPLMLLKRKVKKLIEEENPRKPLTDDQITQILQSQGIDVTRRTVAKYREDMHIPSTHQRRIRD